MRRAVIVALCLVVIASAVVVASAALKPLVFGYVQSPQPLVALTFDCCETRKVTGYDRGIVDYLVKHHIPATFMLCGRWIESHPRQTRYLASIKFFELGNHSYIHPHMTRLSTARIREELVKTQNLLRQYAGRPARFFRPPYGEWDARVAQEAARAGMAVVMWSVVTGDPDPHATVADLVDAVHHARRGSVIIMHANGRGWKTAQALPQIVAYLKRRGLRPVTLRTLVALGKPVNVYAKSLHPKTH